VAYHFVWHQRRPSTMPDSPTDEGPPLAGVVLISLCILVLLLLCGCIWDTIHRACNDIHEWLTELVGTHHRADGCVCILLLTASCFIAYKHSLEADGLWDFAMGQKSKVNTVKLLDEVRYFFLASLLTCAWVGILKLHGANGAVKYGLGGVCFWLLNHNKPADEKTQKAKLTLFLDVLSVFL
jgi:hypothetical protein